jgi:zinc protease
VTDDELDRARKPALTAIRESARVNGYWLGVLSRAQEKPEHLDRARTREADVLAVTAAELSALAKSYLTAERASRILIVPEAKTTSSGASGSNAP